MYFSDATLAAPGCYTDHRSSLRYVCTPNTPISHIPPSCMRLQVGSLVSADCVFQLTPVALSLQCASASRWASHDVITAPDGTRRDPFAEYHATKTRQYIDRTMATGADIFPVLQACILLSWYLYSDGRWVEVSFKPGLVKIIATIYKPDIVCVSHN
jgi:hypothetical protein